MKKLVIGTALVCMALTSQAAVTNQLWTSLFVSAPALTGTETGGEGVGWFVEVWNVTDSFQAYGSTVPSEYGFYDPDGYDIEQFDFTAMETHDVVLRLYNGSTTAGSPYNGESGWVVESAVFSLIDIEGTPGPNDFDVEFDFSTSSWQAVPEPATALLFGIGGLGAFIVRRNKKKAQEEA